MKVYILDKRKRRPVGHRGAQMELAYRRIGILLCLLSPASARQPRSALPRFKAKQVLNIYRTFGRSSGIVGTANRLEPGSMLAIPTALFFAPFIFRQNSHGRLTVPVPLHFAQRESRPWQTGQVVVTTPPTQSASVHCIGVDVLYSVIMCSLFSG